MEVTSNIGTRPLGSCFLFVGPVGKIGTEWSGPDLSIGELEVDTDCVGARLNR